MNSKAHTIKLALNLRSKRVLGEWTNHGYEKNNDSDELARNVFNSVRNIFSDISRDFMANLSELIRSGEIDNAFSFFKDSISLLQFLSKSDYVLIKSFSKLLSDEQLKEIYIYIVALSSEFNLIDDLDEDVETCLRLKDDSM
ncbi:hypothetical protein K3T42_004574 [Salmonella enterica subsp. enterica]|nr:hypothetical protein [Salmonella enterica subsp. enterica]